MTKKITVLKGDRELTYTGSIEDHPDLTDFVRITTIRGEVLEFRREQVLMTKLLQ